MSRYWCRFYVLDTEAPHFEYYGPWWESGVTDGEPSAAIICAAVCAEDDAGARKVIEDSFDAGHTLAEWSFINRRDDDWEPFCDRFSRAVWMKWPWPVAVSKGGV